MNSTLLKIMTMNSKTRNKFLTNEKTNGHSLTSVLVFIIMIMSSCYLSAQTKKSAQFKENHELTEVVVLSRHNIRAPLSGKNSILGKITTHQWTDWTANASELTLKGGVLETMMGQYFRKWLEDENLFEDGNCPSTDDVNIYANSMQRTIATAEYFQAGFLPTCNQNFYHRFSSSKMDPLFFPRLTKVSEAFKQQAMKEINSMGGEKGIVGINESLKPSYTIIEKVTDMKNSPASKEDSKYSSFDDYNTQLIFKLGEEPNLTGSLKTANTIADALILQYFEVADNKEAAFGYDLTTKDWENISRVKDVYGDMLFSTPIVAVNVAHPLLMYIKDELQSKHRKFTFLVGHDSNIASILSSLGVEEYSLPNTIEKKTPIGSKLVFEKWQDKQTKEEFITINLVYQTTNQLRHLELLTLSNPPASYPLKLSGMSANEFGLYKFNDVVGRFDQAILAYDDIK